MHAVLIENPKAGRVSPASRSVVERALEATFDLELARTDSRGHAAVLAREAVEAGAKTVIAYGGDGTVNEVINGMLGTDDSTEVVFAALPGGTTNVLARNLGYPNDLVEAAARLIEIVERGEPKRRTVGRISADTPTEHIERAFAFAAGVVLDGEIVKRVDRMKRRRRNNDGAFIYFGLRAFFALRRHGEADLTLDTPTGPQEAYWACIAADDPYTYLRSRGIRVAPDAGSSGGLDLVAAQQLRLVPSLRWMAQALGKANHVRHKKALHLAGQDSIHVTSKRPVPLQTDGEYLGDVVELTARALPSALPVWG
jgi:diacylglycerol kinase family enzyme